MILKIFRFSDLLEPLGNRLFNKKVDKHGQNDLNRRHYPVHRGLAVRQIRSGKEVIDLKPDIEREIKRIKCVGYQTERAEHLVSDDLIQERITDDKENERDIDHEQRRQSKFGRHIELVCQVDEGLLGGISVRLDGVVMDGSLRRRLQVVKDVIEQ